MLLGILLGLGTSACWAVANVAIQRAGRAVGALRAMLWMQLVGGAGFALIAPFTDTRSAPFTTAALPWIALLGVAGLLAYVCLFHAFEHGRLSVAVPIVSSWAVISAAISVVAFGERVAPQQLVGAAMVVAGAVVVSRYAQAPDEPRRQGRRPAWVLTAFGAAIGFGVLIPAMGRLVSVTGQVGTTVLVYGANLLLALPLALVLRIDLRPPAGRAWLPVAVAGIFETLGFASIAFAAGWAPLALVSPLASLSSAFTVAFAWMVLRERPQKVVAAGAILAAGGVVVLAL